MQPSPTPNIVVKEKQEKKKIDFPFRLALNWFFIAKTNLWSSKVVFYFSGLIKAKLFPPRCHKDERL